MKNDMKIDLVCVEFGKNGSQKKYLYKAPMYTDLNPGDMVWCENTTDLGIVVASRRIYSSDDEDYRFMLTIAGATEPLKRITRVARVSELIYEEDSDGADV